MAAPAKINLNLLVGPVRADGYHPVDSLIAKVSLYDEVLLHPRDDGRIEFSCAGIDCGPDESNLAHRAARLIQRRRGHGGADVRLNKAIPPGAGLGGGSSDAAAVLAGLAAMWKLDIPPTDLADAAALGSDVPLFLGPACCRATGRGEVVEPVEVHDFTAVLVMPPAPCRTSGVYRAHDACPTEIGPQLDRRMLAEEPPSRWRGLLRNDLSAAARRVNAELDIAWNELSGALAEPVCMSGSGSALFVLCDDDREAQAVRRAWPARYARMSMIVRKNPW